MQKWTMALLGLIVMSAMSFAGYYCEDDGIYHYVGAPDVGYSYFVSAPTGILFGSPRCTGSVYVESQKNYEETGNAAFDEYWYCDNKGDMHLKDSSYGIYRIWYGANPC